MDPVSARRGSERRVPATIGGGRELAGDGAAAAGAGPTGAASPTCFERGGSPSTLRRPRPPQPPRVRVTQQRRWRHRFAKPAIASITARSTANHRDRPRPASSATPRRHLLDSSVGGGSKGTGAPVNVDINRRSLPPREATTYGPKGRDDVDRVVGYSPSSTTVPRPDAGSRAIADGRPRRALLALVQASGIACELRATLGGALRSDRHRR